MIERRRGNLDLPALRRDAILRQNGGQQFHLLDPQRSLLFLGEMFAFRGKRRNDRIPREIFLVHPRQLRQHLQIPPVPGAEMRRRRLRSGSLHLPEQIHVPRPARHQIVVIQLKRALEYFRLLLRRQRLRRRKCRVKPRLLESPAGIILNLRRERRHHVERRMHAGEFLHDLHHSPVILQRVQARPRQHVAPRRRVAVLRLMHVPDQNDVNGPHRHTSRKPASCIMLE